MIPPTWGRGTSAGDDPYPSSSLLLCAETIAAQGRRPSRPIYEPPRFPILIEDLSCKMSWLWGDPLLVPFGGGVKWGGSGNTPQMAVCSASMLVVFYPVEK